MHSLYRSSTRGPEDDSVESKHVAPLSHYMFNFTTVVFDGTSPTFYFTNTSGWNTSSSNYILYSTFIIHIKTATYFGHTYVAIIRVYIEL